MLVLLCRAQEIASIGTVKNKDLHLKSKMQLHFSDAPMHKNAYN